MWMSSVVLESDPGVPAAPRLGSRAVRHCKGLGLGKLFLEVGILSRAPSKKDAESTGAPFPGGSTCPQPQPCPGWGSGSLSVSWTINAMHWSSKNVAIFLYLFFYLCC